MQIEKAGHGLTIKLDGTGSLAFFLQTLLRAKFYDDGGVDGLLSPLLNSALKATLETIGTEQPDTANYYAGWVQDLHQARVQALVSTSSGYRSASVSGQKAMMRTALFPLEPNE